MGTSPKTAEKDMMAVDALLLMRQHNITQLVITDKGKYVGMIHIHDLVKEGII
jgi:arabinose-5-phosphate isomerase